MRHPTRHRQVYAIVRIDLYQGQDVSWQNKVTIKEIVESVEAAQQEVERLNQLNADKDCLYFWQTTRMTTERD